MKCKDKPFKITEKKYPAKCEKGVIRHKPQKEDFCG